MSTGKKTLQYCCTLFCFKFTLETVTDKFPHHYLAKNMLWAPFVLFPILQKADRPKLLSLKIKQLMALQLVLWSPRYPCYDSTHNEEDAYCCQWWPTCSSAWSSARCCCWPTTSLSPFSFFSFSLDTRPHQMVTMTMYRSEEDALSRS